MSGRDELKLEFKVSAYTILNVCLFSILEDRMAFVSDIQVRADGDIPWKLFLQIRIFLVSYLYLNLLLYFTNIYVTYFRYDSHNRWANQYFIHYVH